MPTRFASDDDSIPMPVRGRKNGANWSRQTGTAPLSNCVLKLLFRRDWPPASVFSAPAASLPHCAAQPTSGQGRVVHRVVLVWANFLLCQLAAGGLAARDRRDVLANRK